MGDKHCPLLLVRVWDFFLVLFLRKIGFDCGLCFFIASILKEFLTLALVMLQCSKHSALEAVILIFSQSC